MASGEPPEHPKLPPLPGINPANLNYAFIVKEIQKQFTRLIAEVQGIESLLKKLLQGLDDYHTQAEKFVLILNAYSQYVDVQPGQSSREGEAVDPQKPEDKVDVKEQPRLNVPESSNRDLPPDTSSVSEQAADTEGMKDEPMDTSTQEKSHTGDTTLSWKAPKVLSPAKSSGEGDTKSKEEPGSTLQQIPKSICWDPEDTVWERSHTLSSEFTRVYVPQKLEKIWKLKHGTPVLATALSSITRHAFTCGRDGVKVWSLVGQAVENVLPESHLYIPTQGAFVRTSHLTSDSTTLLMAGNTLAGVSVWDLKAPTLRMKSKLPCTGLSCQALASSRQDRLALGSLSNGTIRIWDLQNQQVVRDLVSPHGPATKIVVTEQQVWAGSLEGSLRCWDLRSAAELQKYQFDSQIMALAAHPQEDFVLVGLGSGQQWLQPTSGGLKQMVGCKENTILDLTFSPEGQWWASVGMDNLLSIHKMPAGTVGLQVLESSSITCCDVAQNNRLIITGSKEHSTVYQILY